jgi:transcriptional regulator with GAF, ATPase, and Fis domain
VPTEPSRFGHPVMLEHPANLDRPEDEAIRARLVEELQRATGSVAAVARTMGKARMQVQRWMKRFNLDPKMFRAP